MFKEPDPQESPDKCIMGPVILDEWMKVWIGARRATNNTGELSAMIEAMLWTFN